MIPNTSGSDADDFPRVNSNSDTHGFRYALDPSSATRSTREAFDLGGLIRVSNLPRVFRDNVTGKCPSPKSVYRWIASGFQGHRLRVVRMPFGLVTTPAWLDEFIQKINTAAPAGLPVTLSRRRKSVAEARAEADRIVNSRRGDR